VAAWRSQGIGGGRHRIGGDGRGQGGIGLQHGGTDDIIRFGQHAQRFGESSCGARLCQQGRRHVEQGQRPALARAGLDAQLTNTSLGAPHALEILERPRRLVGKRTRIGFGPENVERVGVVQRQVGARAWLAGREATRVLETGDSHPFLHVFAVVPAVEVRLVGGVDVGPDAEQAPRGFTGHVGSGRFNRGRRKGEAP